MSSIRNSPVENCVGLIPAAGKGTRLGLPFPKELYPFISANTYKPIAQFSLEYILNVGIQHVVFVINETKHALLEYFGNGSKFNSTLSYVVQEHWQNDPHAKSPGLAHALNSAYHLIKEKNVFFSMADTIISPQNIFTQAKDAAPEDTEVLLCLFPTKRPEKYGMVEFSSNHRVNKIIDKPQNSNLQLMWGCIIWTPKFTEYLYQSVINHGLGDFAVILNNAITDGIKINSYEVQEGLFFDIGTYEEIEDVYNFLHNKK